MIAYSVINIIMKGSLMKPPVVAEIYDHKVYSHRHIAITRTICRS
jgi:hypothetical protein